MSRPDNEVRLVIPGMPVAKQRARRARAGNWFTPKPTRVYEELVAWHARTARPLGSVPVAVRIELWSTRALRGDLDNYAKAILDGIVKGGLIDDDRQVVALAVNIVVGGEEQAIVNVLPLRA